MKPILLMHATRQGQTRRIAEHLGATLTARHCPFELLDAASIPPGFSITDYSAAIVTASLHFGKHEAEMVTFVKRYLPGLQRIPTVFLSVSLAEAGVEDKNASEKRRAEALAEVQKPIEKFLMQTRWQPTLTKAVAGALRYSRYNFAIRFVMRHIAKSVGMPTDTTRDYEYTDWAAVDRVVDDLPVPSTT